MKDETFQELLQGVREGGAYLRGELKPARTTRVRVPAAKPEHEPAKPKRAAKVGLAENRVRMA